MPQKVKWTTLQQADLTEMSKMADLDLDNAEELVKLLLFNGDFRLAGGTIIEASPASGVAKITVGTFVKTGGRFYTLASENTANILTGVEDQPAGIWGTGQAADPTDPRKDIIVVTAQAVDGTSQLKTFIDVSTDPPTQFQQNTNTRTDILPLFSVLHGTPSPTPSEPAIPSGFMKLASIDVPAGATDILTANITEHLNINPKSLEQLQLVSQAHFSAVRYSALGWRRPEVGGLY